MAHEPNRREPLTPERIFAAALALADRDGLQRLSMRKIAEQLGVEAMSLYHHVANKDAILDGLVDAVFAEIEAPSAGEPWREALARRCHSAREVLLRHPWALGLLDSRRNPGLQSMLHREAVIGCLRAGGFSIRGAAHVFSLVDSYLYGFVLQELSMPIRDRDALEDVGGAIAASLPVAQFPAMAEMLAYVLTSDYAFADEFAVGLRAVLDAAGRLRES